MKKIKKYFWKIWLVVHFIILLPLILIFKLFGLEPERYKK